MPTFEDVYVLAAQLTPEERQRLAQAIVPAARPSALGVLSPRPPAPQSAAWVRAERGHAVLATDAGPADAEIPAGPDAIAGMWADMTSGNTQGGQE